MTLRFAGFQETAVLSGFYTKAFVPADDIERAKQIGKRREIGSALVIAWPISSSYE